MWGTCADRCAKVRAWRALIWTQCDVNSLSLAPAGSPKLILSLVAAGLSVGQVPAPILLADFAHKRAVCGVLDGPKHLEARGAEQRRAEVALSINHSTGLGLYFAGRIAGLHERNGAPRGGGEFRIYLP